MTVKLVDALDEEVRSAIEGHRLRSVFSSPPWIEALARTYGHKVQAFVSIRQGRVAGAIPFVRVSDMRGDRIISLPFSDYCDPLVEAPVDWNALIAPILDCGVPVGFRLLHQEVALGDPRFTAATHALWHAVDLTRPENELWAGLGGSARQNVRKAQRNGIVVREGRSREDVQAFHRMHRHLRKAKYRLLAQPAAFFDALYDAFTPENRLTVLLAELDGEPIAGILFLEWGGTLFYKFNASLKPELCPNDLLAWEGIRMGQRRGLVRLDFGLSDIEQPGLVRYKRKYATQERAITTLRWRPPGYVDPRGDQVGQVLGRMTVLLTRPDVPDDVTAAAGDELYRFFC